MKNRFLSALALALTVCSCHSVPSFAAQFTVADNYAPLRYTATASQTTFTVTWPFEAEEDLVVKVDAGATGTFATKTLTTDYTTTGESTTNGGTVVFGTGLSAGDIVVITRDSGVTDGTDFGASVTTSALNLRFDQQALALQEVESDVQKRALLLPETEPFSTVSGSIPSASASAGKLLGYKSDGTGFEAVSSSLNGSSPTTVNGGTFASQGTPIVLRNGSTATREVVTLDTAECAYDTDRNLIYCGDGSTAGGLPVGMDVFNVESYGVDCAAGGDDTAALAAAIDDAEAESGGIIYTRPGCQVDVVVQAQDTPIFLLASDNLMFWSYGATFKVTATAATQPSTLALEREYAWVFKAIGQSDIQFLGGSFDGSWDDTYDPSYGFFMGAKTNRVLVRDMALRNISNFHGAIFGTGWDVVASDPAASSGARLDDWRVENNLIEKAHAGIWIEEAMRSIYVVGNTLRDMTVAEEYSTLGPAFLDTRYGAGNYRLCRPIRIQGYTNTTAATHGVSTDIEVTDNTIEGGGWSIELYNGTTKDPTNATRVNVSRNKIWGEHGISVNFYGSVDIGHNIVKRMTDTDLTTYAGRKYEADGASPTALTAVSFGWGLETHPSLDYQVHDNILDGSSSAAQLNGSPTGIIVGGSAATFRTTSGVYNNHVKNFYLGIRIGQSENTTIEGNRVHDCRSGIVTDWNYGTGENRVSASGFTWGNNVLRNNDVRLDETGGALGVQLEGDWVVDGGTITGSLTTSGVPLLNLRGFDSDADGSDADMGNFVVRGVHFKNFRDYAISDSDTASAETLSVLVDDCTFDTNTTPTTVMAAYRVSRSTSVNKEIRFGRNRAIGLSGLILLDDTSVGALTETYDFGEWDTDSQVTTPFRDYGGSGVVAGGTPIIGFGRSRKIIQVDVSSGSGTGDPIIDVAGLLPANSIIWGVSSENKSTIVGSTGVTSYSIGTTTDADAWGATTPLANTSTTKPSLWTVASGAVLTGTSAADLRLTAVGGGDPYFVSGTINLIVDYSAFVGDAP